MRSASDIQGNTETGADRTGDCVDEDDITGGTARAEAANVSERRTGVQKKDTHVFGA